MPRKPQGAKPRPNPTAKAPETVTVRCLVPATGGRDIGAEIEVGPAEAKRLLDGGLVEAVAKTGAERTGAGPASGVETR